VSVERIQKPEAVVQMSPVTVSDNSNADGIKRTDTKLERIAT
jgi:hypothetical protein